MLRQLARSYHSPAARPNKYRGVAVVCLMFVCSLRRGCAIFLGGPLDGPHPQNELLRRGPEVLRKLCGDLIEPYLARTPSKGHNRTAWQWPLLPAQWRNETNAHARSAPERLVGCGKRTERS